MIKGYQDPIRGLAYFVDVIAVAHSLSRYSSGYNFIGILVKRLDYVHALRKLVSSHQLGNDPESRRKSFATLLLCCSIPFCRGAFLFHPFQHRVTHYGTRSALDVVRLKQKKRLVNKHKNETHEINAQLCLIPFF